ncbi:MAG: hypothetical protein ACT6QS_16175 [Flavobacteriales bacterium]
MYFLFSVSLKNIGVVFSSVSILLFNIGCGRQQHPVEFEGMIEYRIDILSENAGLGAQERLGRKGVFYYKKGEFASFYPEGKELEAIYNKRDNMEYTKMRDSDTLLSSDCGVQDRELLKQEKFRNDTTILGYPCHKLVFTDNKGAVSTYWYSDSLYVDGKRFKDREFGFVNRYYAEANAMILKYKYEGRNYSSAKTAVKVERKKLDDHIFELPDLPKKKWVF